MLRVMVSAFRHSFFEGRKRFAPAMFVTLCVAVMLCGCSRSRIFTVDGASDDIGTQNVTLVYQGDAGVDVHTVSAVDGRFHFEGSVEQPTYIEVFSAPGKKLGELIAEGGDEIKARFSVLNPENIEVKGNADSERLTKFMADNRPLLAPGKEAELNAAIDAYVTDNPKRKVSAVLLTQYYHVKGFEARAMELLRMIPSKNRKDAPAVSLELLLSRAIDADTAQLSSVQAFGTTNRLERFTPKGAPLTLWMITDNESRQSDSVRNLTKAMRNKYDGKHLKVIDLGTDRDTLQWYSTLRNLNYRTDTLAVTRGWLPAGVATAEIAEIAPEGIPFFMVTDSVGKILFKSGLTSETERYVGHR